MVAINIASVVVALLCGSIIHVGATHYAEKSTTSSSSRMDSDLPFNISNARCVYYTPGVIGLNGDNGYANFFASAYSDIHRRDLRAIASFANCIRISGLPNKPPKPFFRIVDTFKLDVIATFSSSRYDLLYSESRGSRSVLVHDFHEFIGQYRLLPAIKWWALVDIETALPTFSPYAAAQMFLTLSALTTAARVYDSRPIIMPVFLAGIQNLDYVGDFDTLDFDIWLFNIDNLSPTGYIERATGALAHAHHQRPVIVQFTSSPWDFDTNMANDRKQTTTIHELLAATKYINAQTPTSQAIVGIILQEWADQWWRNEPTSSIKTCQTAHPYVQAPCGTAQFLASLGNISLASDLTTNNYNGLAAQYNLYGSHCLRVRLAGANISAIWAQETGRGPPLSENQTLCSTQVFALVDYANPHIVWVCLFPLPLLLFVSLFFYCRNATKKSKHDPTAIGCDPHDDRDDRDLVVLGDFDLDTGNLEALSGTLQDLRDKYTSLKACQDTLVVTLWSKDGSDADLTSPASVPRNSELMDALSLLETRCTRTGTPTLIPCSTVDDDDDDDDMPSPPPTTSTNAPNAKLLRRQENAQNALSRARENNYELLRGWASDLASCRDDIALAARLLDTAEHQLNNVFTHEAHGAGISSVTFNDIIDALRSARALLKELRGLPVTFAETINQHNRALVLASVPFDASHLADSIGLVLDANGWSVKCSVWRPRALDGSIKLHLGAHDTESYLWIGSHVENQLRLWRDRIHSFCLQRTTCVAPAGAGQVRRLLTPYDLWRLLVMRPKKLYGLDLDSLLRDKLRANTRDPNATPGTLSVDSPVASALILLFGIVGSVSEQIIYCPAALWYKYQQILNSGDTVILADRIELDLKPLVEPSLSTPEALRSASLGTDTAASAARRNGSEDAPLLRSTRFDDDFFLSLERIHARRTFDDVHFDDIDDFYAQLLGPSTAGVLEQRPTKHFHESPSIFVLIDLLRNVSSLILIKMWVLVAAFFASLAYHIAYPDPVVVLALTYDVVALYGATIDFCAWFAVELLSILHLLASRRTNRHLWTALRGAWVAAPLVASTLNFAFGLLAFYLAPSTLLQAAYPALRVSYCLIFQCIVPRTKLFDYFATDRAKLTPVVGHTRRLAILWFAILCTSFLLDFGLFVPSLLGVTPSSMCNLACQTSTGTLEFVFHSNVCIACTLGVLCVWLLVVLSSYVAVFILYSLFISCYGVIVGFNRKLPGSGLHATKGSFSIGPKGEQGATFARHFALPSSDGSRFWGPCNEMWRAAILDLHERSLIFESEARSLLSTTGSVEFSNLSNLSSVAQRRLWRLCSDSYTEGDSRRMRLPSLKCDAPLVSQIVLCYSETILEDWASLVDMTMGAGEWCRLHFLVREAPDEWAVFCEHLQKLAIARLNPRSAGGEGAPSTPADESLVFDHTPWYGYSATASPAERDFLVRLLGDGSPTHASLADFATNLLQQIPYTSPEALGMFQDKIRLWASFRSQTLARTIRGAVTYQKAARAREHSRLCVANSAWRRAADALLDLRKDNPHAIWCAPAFDEVVKDKGELDDEGLCEFRSVVEQFEPRGQIVFSHQTFGKRDNDRVRADVLRVLHEYRHYWVDLVFDVALDDGDRNPLVRLIKAHHDNRNLSIGGNIKYASCVGRLMRNKAGSTVEWNGLDGNALDHFQLVSCVFRRYPLRLGDSKFPFQTQGKPANQILALHGVCGPAVVCMDANQDGFVSECLRLPDVASCLFTVAKNSKFEDGDDTPVIGSREDVMTERQSLVGCLMAQIEETFGSLTQRSLASLGIRLHYGHPDLLSLLFILSAGGLAKGSPVVHLSEDVTTGYRVLMALREWCGHSDEPVWLKGRETAFRAATQFFDKIAMGSVVLMQTRELQLLYSRMGVLGSASMFFSTTGHFMSQFLMDFGIFLYVLTFLFLSLGQISIMTIGLVGSTIAAEWVIGFGALLAVSFLFYSVLERHLEGLFPFVATFVQGSLFFAFNMRITASAVSKAVRTGLAEYVSTGRPLPYERPSLVDLYHYYRTPAYCRAINILIMYILYRGLVDESGGYLPMFLPLIAVSTLLLLPILFSPFPASSISAVQDAFLFLFRYNAKDDRDNDEQKKARLANASEGATLFEKGRREMRSEVAMDHWVYWPTRVLFELAACLVLFSVAYSSFIDYLFFWLLALEITIIVTVLRRFRPNSFTHLLFLLAPILTLLLAPVNFLAFPILGIELLYSGLLYASATRLIISIFQLVLKAFESILHPRRVRQRHAALNQCDGTLRYVTLNDLHDGLDRAAREAHEPSPLVLSAMDFVFEASMLFHLEWLRALVVFSIQSALLLVMALLDLLLGLPSALYFHTPFFLGGALFGRFSLAPLRRQVADAADARDRRLPKKQIGKR